MDEHEMIEAIAYHNGYKRGVEEFAERLKERNKLYCTGDEDVKEMNFVVDQIAKEMGVEL